MAALPLLRWGATPLRSHAASRLFSALRRPSAAARSEPGSKVVRKGRDYPELEKWVQSQGFRQGQAMMLWKCLYGNKVSVHRQDELAGLNKNFSKMVTDHADLKALTVKDIINTSDGTRKILFSLEDGSVIETVAIPCSRGRTTVCVSSQVGCTMNCQFCFTGRMGLRKHLSTAEIVEQAVFALSTITVDEQGLHFSPRKVIVSTSGLVPQIKHFLHESNCALAVSLNATTDEVRNWIMPINRKYNFNSLLCTLREELRLKKKYKVFFEYVMLAGVNDSVDDAKRLVDMVRGIPCKMNLISFNPHSGSQFKPTPDEKIIEFRNILIQEGLIVFVRLSRGDDQMAARGQLGETGDYQLPLLRVPERFQVAL
ncbi:hypothetical protein ABZP36_024518 [Zizania latifolia]